jgi:hypothetical protein
LAINYSSNSRGLLDALVKLFSAVGGIYMVCRILFRLFEYLLASEDTMDSVPKIQQKPHLQEEGMKNMELTPRNTPGDEESTHFIEKPPQI